MAAANPLLNPNSTLSGPALLNAARQLAAAQTSGPLAELARQIAANQRQTRGTMNLAGKYFGQLGGQAQQGVTQENQLAGNLNSTLSGIGQQTQSALQGIGQQAHDTLAKYSPQGEGGLSNAAQQSLTAELARQQGLAAQQSGAFQGFGANQGANYSGLANTNLGVNALRGTEAIKGIGQAGTVLNQPLAAKQAALREQQGALVATDLGKLRQQEINNRITEQGLGLKQQANQLVAQRQQIQQQNNLANQQLRAEGINVQQQNNLANQALRASQIRTTGQNDLANQALKQAALNLKAASAGGKGGTKPLTTAQNNALQRNLGEMTSLIVQAQKAGHSEADIRQALATGGLQKGFPAQSQVLVEAAYELLGYGHLLRSTAAAMKAMGMRGGTFRGKPITVGPGPQGAGGIGVKGLASALQSIGNAL